MSRKEFAYPFQDPDLGIEARIDNIISLMTLEEKIACLSTNPSVPRLGIKGCSHVEGLHGLAMGTPGDWGRGFPVTTTQFPQAIGMGETWDPELVRQAGAIEGHEVRFVYQSPKYQRGGLVVRAPNADLGRDPRWGRTEECFGEDPFFNGTMAAAMSRGLQGDDKTYWLTASLLKHFLANSNENGRGYTSSNFDARLFHEYYSVPFRMAVTEGGSRCYMTAYNAYNGVPCIVNDFIRKVTMKDWGVDGIVCTDGGAFKLLVTDHRYYPDLEFAAAACVKFGINQFLDRFQESVRAALGSGLLKEVEVDEVIRGDFRVMIRLGLLDPAERVPYSSIGGGEDPWLSEKHRTFARTITEKSVVLLKNEGGLLPLDRKKLRTIAVVGNRADAVLLDWYSGSPPYTVTPYQGIATAAGKSVTVRIAADDSVATAAKLASECDVAVVCVGNHPTGGSDLFGVECVRPSDGKEAVDRKSVVLEDEELIRQVFRANPRTVVCLISSFPFAIVWSQHNIPAILHMTQNSQELGTALAGALFGDFNPAGRLVQTWVRSEKDLPEMLDYDIRRGRTYMYFQGEPLYPFGHGLSYTRFEYSNLRLGGGRLAAGSRIDVSVDVENTGGRDGDEVVQMYVSHPRSSVPRPGKALKGFKRVSIPAGRTVTVTIPLPAAALAYWDTASGGWKLEDGEVLVMIGASSTDLRLSASVSVTASAP